MPEDRHSGTPGGGNGSGADVKSGTVSSAGDDAQGDVVFGTAFASTPRVVASLDPTGGFGDDTVFIIIISTTGFTWRTFKGHGGSGHTYNIHWIATDAGNP